MSVTLVLEQWRELLNGSIFVPQYLKGAYLRMPPIPYAGDYPFAVIRPRTMQNLALSNQGRQRNGFYRITFLDQLGSDTPDIGHLIEEAEVFSQALIDAIDTTPSIENLNGAVNWIGQGRGIIVNYDSIEVIRDIYDFPLYSITIDVDSQEETFNGS